MKFNNLDNKIENCNAVENAIEDNSTLFIRKLRTSEVIMDVDFQTHYEQGKSPCIIESDTDWKDCELFKNCNSLSVNIFNKEIRSEVLESYKLKFRVSPNYKGGAVIFKIKNKGGLVEHTPSQFDRNHFSLYKKDDFSIDDLEVVDLFALKDKCI